MRTLAAIAEAVALTAMGVLVAGALIVVYLAPTGRGTAL